eukprot:350631-Chlamydomonas_euryale.AAC.4
MLAGSTAGGRRSSRLRAGVCMNHPQQAAIYGLAASREETELQRGGSETNARTRKRKASEEEAGRKQKEGRQEARWSREGPPHVRTLFREERVRWDVEGIQDRAQLQVGAVQLLHKERARLRRGARRSACACRGTRARVWRATASHAVGPRGEGAGGGEPNGQRAEVVEELVPAVDRHDDGVAAAAVLLEREQAAFATVGLEVWRCVQSATLG